MISDHSSLKKNASHMGLLASLSVRIETNTWGFPNTSLTLLSLSLVFSLFVSLSSSISLFLYLHLSYFLPSSFLFLQTASASSSFKEMQDDERCVRASLELPTNCGSWKIPKISPGSRRLLSPGWCVAFPDSGWLSGSKRRPSFLSSNESFIVYLGKA